MNPERRNGKMILLVQIANILMPVVIAFGFWFAWRQVDAIRRARMAEIILMLYERWDSNFLEESRKALYELGSGQAVKKEIIKAHEEKLPALYPLVRVGNFFDTVGALVTQGFLDKEVAFKLMGTAFETYKGLYKDILIEPRFRGFLKCFTELDEIFDKIKASQSKVKARRI